MVVTVVWFVDTIIVTQSETAVVVRGIIPGVCEQSLKPLKLCVLESI